VQSRRADEYPSEAAVPRLTAAEVGTLLGKAAQQAMREVNREQEEEVKKQWVWPHVHWSDLQAAADGDESPSAETRSAEEKTALRTETCEASTHQDSAPSLWYPRR
jgi:nitric oxide reductase activation protein